MQNDFYQLVIDKLELIPREDGTLTLMLWGWALDTAHEDVEKFSLKVNGKETYFRIRRTPREDVRSWYEAAKDNPHPGFIIRADLPDQNVESVSLQVNDHPWRNLDRAMIRDAWNKDGVDISFDFCHMKPGNVSAGGWYYSTDPEKAKFEVLDGKGRLLKDAKVALGSRFDVERAYFVKDERVTGFSISLRQDPLPTLPLQLKVTNNQGSWTVPVERIGSDNFNWFSLLQPKKLKSGWRYLRTNGVRPLLSRLRFHSKPATDDFNEKYNEWFLSHRSTPEELARQKKHVFDYQPKISLIVAAFNTPIDLLEAMIDSVKTQTYPNWQLCIADGSTDDKVETWLKNHPDERISWTRLHDNLGISGNMNAAADLATGDYIALYDHDDFLEPDALYEVVKVINEEKPYDFIYTDEDKFDDATKKYVGPNFKPDFSPALLQSTNYICHFLAVRSDVYKAVGGQLRSEFDGAQDYDLVLRLMDYSKPENIRHIPKILYHWRMHSGSTALDAGSKKWAYTAGERALEDWARRNHIDARVMNSGWPGQYHVRFKVQGNPKVSVIIPSKDHAEDLRICVDSLMRRTKYENIEIIVVENNSTEPETFEAYKQLEKDYPNLKVIEWKHPFNYSAINNFAVKHSTGDYLLFLNNDTETMNHHVIDEMLGQAQQPGVGAVGAKLYYEDGTIQHNGVIIGHSGVAGHAMIGQTDLCPNYQIRTTYDVSAVTAACMMVPRKVFDETGGFNEDLKVAYNDIDFCLRIRRLGYRIVQDTFANLYHYESKTRGYEDSEEKKARFESEVRKMYSLWPDELRSEDPYYNPNLDLTGITYELRKDDEVNPFINPDFLGEAYYTAGTIRPPRKGAKTGTETNGNGSK